MPRLRCWFVRGDGIVWDAIEERSFVAKGAPLDDRQVRLDGRTGRLGEEDGLNPLLLRCAKSAAPGKSKATAFEADPSLRFGMTAFFVWAIEGEILRYAQNDGVTATATAKVKGNVNRTRLKLVAP